MEEFAIYVVALNPIKIQTSDDDLNLLFVKYINVVGEKMVRYGRKITNSKSYFFFHTFLRSLDALKFCLLIITKALSMLSFEDLKGWRYARPNDVCFTLVRTLN